jgi:PKD repeat protein
MPHLPYRSELAKHLVRLLLVLMLQLGLLAQRNYSSPSNISTPPQTTSSLQFGAASYSVAENAGSINVTVTRTGAMSGAATVDYATGDDTATQKSKYILNAGTLNFATGEASKTITILIVDNTIIDGTESFKITLSNPSGVALGTPATTIVSINDNDTVKSNNNALEDAQFFVREHYLDFLNREPDAGGLGYWTNELNKCGTNEICLHQRRIGVSTAFLMEMEFLQTGYVVYRMHRAAYGTLSAAPNRANLIYSQFMADSSQLIGGPQLPQSTVDYASRFVQRTAFKAVYPDAMSPLDFVNKLFDTASLSPYTTERQQEATALANNSKTRAQVLLDVIEINEFKQREYNPAFVLEQYYGYLRRDPEQDGYDFWLDVLNNREPHNFRGVVCSFITSREYQERFSTASTRSNADCQNNGPTGNHPPTVNAGAEQTITLPVSLLSLSGTVMDDGLPAGHALKLSWSKVSGPGTVLFDNPTQKETTATFGAAGTYLLQLVADDSQLTNSDFITVTLKPARDATPPTLTINPAHNATVNTTLPLIEVAYSDAGSGVDTTTLSVIVDGTNITNLFTVTDSKASYQLSLGGGQHTIEASIKDKEGNLAQATSKFTISVFRALPEAIPASGIVPLTVNFITKAEYTDGAIIRYRWDFQGDGIFDTNDPGARNYTRTFTQKGTFNAVLEVTNDKNQIATKTVPIVVTGSPPVATASLNPSNGAIPLLVNFTGAGTDTDGSIVKFEWDFDGDGTFDFTSTTTGNTTHSYNTAGTYNAVFRVTDNDGLTATARVTATTVRIGPPGSPTATITSPANPLTVIAPNTVSFNGTGTDLDGTIAKYEWDFDGNGVYDYSSATTAATSFKYESPGTYTAALRVTDNAGLTGIDTIDITVNLPITLSLSNDTCRPLQGGTINVNTTQGGATPVTIFIQNKVGQTVKTLVSNAPRTAGSYSDTWDCKDTSGAVVPEGAYYAILQYLANGQVKTLDLTNSTGGLFYNPNWNMSTTGGTACFDCPFKPLENSFLKVDFVLTKASEVSVSIRLFNRVDEVVSLFDRKLFGRGSYTAFWDGTDITGRIVTPPPGEQFLWGMTAFTLPDNAIFVEVAPQLTAVAANPNYFDPSTGNFISPQNPTTKISYTLTKQANVTLQVFRAGTNALMRTIIQPNVAAGNGTIEWDGRNANGIFADKGDYRLAVKATDAAGNQSIVRYILVRVFH